MIINQKKEIIVRGFIPNSSKEYLPVILGVKEVDPLKIIQGKNFSYFYYEINHKRQPETYYNGTRIDALELKKQQLLKNSPVSFIESLIKKGFSEIIQVDTHIVGAGENDYIYEEILSSQKRR
ncbi:MAG: hypothetical protein GX641_01985 [Mollicutes bacterium]|nr:hypothetical protein [Mollicutes bacterium]